MISTLNLFNECSTILLSHVIINVILDKLSLRQILVGTFLYVIMLLWIFCKYIYIILDYI